MKIYLVRHGEVISNALKHYNEDSDDLTELGIKQAEELREKIKDLEVKFINSCIVCFVKNLFNYFDLYGMWIMSV